MSDAAGRSDLERKCDVAIGMANTGFANRQRLQADLSALQLLVAEVAAAAGVTEVGGLPLGEWYERERRRQLDALLRWLEDRCPSLAAEVLDVLDGE